MARELPGGVVARIQCCRFRGKSISLLFLLTKLASNSSQGGSPIMDTRVRLLETAGKVIHLLNTVGPLTVAQLRKQLNGRSELLSFAVGWLAREDRIEIVQAKKSFRLHLKQ